jgi:HTH-type transcriptional regulator / antitoxin HipB
MVGSDLPGLLSKKLGCESPLGDILECRQMATFAIVANRRLCYNVAKWRHSHGENEMRIRTPADFGALIRDHRIALGLDQKTLAQKVGASRQWIVDAEKGKPRSEIGLLLRTIATLGIALTADREGSRNPKDAAPSEQTATPVDINYIIESARTKRT